MMLSVFCRGENERRNPCVAKGVPPVSGVPVKRMPGWFAIPFSIAVALMASPAALADELQDYARECDETFAPSVRDTATVKDFDCDASTCPDPTTCDPGTEVPVVHLTGSGTDAICDQPNRLNRECDPGSHFKVLARTDDAYVVAHCRKKMQDPGKYGDIAVIQYNRKNGATCFYQALGLGLSGHVKAPSNGQKPNTIWQSPSVTARGGCGGCHDNGPLIRSPYLNQIKSPDKNALPGSDYQGSGGEGKEGFNFNSDFKTNLGRSWPYAFVGKDFASWKAFRVEVGNECTSCHRLGVNNVTSGGGTALDFAIRATSDTEFSPVFTTPASPFHKTFPPSAASPVWMPPAPVQIPPLDPEHEKSAKAIRECALRFRVCPGPNCPPNYVLPSEPTCRITLFAAAYTAPAPPPPDDIATIMGVIFAPDDIGTIINENN